MLTRPFAFDDESGGRRTRWAIGLGLTACFCLGCPGVEPSADGSGGAGAGGAPSASSTSKSSSGQGAGGESASTTSGTGGNNEGGCDADVLNDVDNCGACGRACADGERVAEPRCVGGVCESFCQSGFVNFKTPAAPAPDDGCEALGRRVFVTSQTFVANEIGGVNAADEYCQSLADQLELGGKWRAWLSEGGNLNTPVAARFDKVPAAPYRLLDFTQVAASWDALTNPSAGSLLEHPINLTETLATVAGSSSPVWTGTTATGLATGIDCGGWGNALEQTGTVGDCTQVTRDWTYLIEQPGKSCTTQARLYCFEQ